MSKKVLFQTTQFTISTLFSSIQPIDRSGPGNDGNKGVHCILVASPSDFFVSYPGHSLGEFYSSAEMQLVYSASTTNWANL